MQQHVYVMDWTTSRYERNPTDEEIFCESAGAWWNLVTCL